MYGIITLQIFSYKEIRNMTKLYTIGQLFQNMRNKKNFTRAELTEGLCSPSVLEKIEEDQIEPNVLLVKLLMQRLGNSPSKLEYILSNQDYKWLDSYDQFLEFIFRKRGDWCNWLLPRLRKAQKTNPIQEMIYYRCHAMYQYYIKGDKNFAAQELTKAILQTSSSILAEGLPINEWFIQYTSIDKNLYTKKHRCILSVMELENLIALLRILNEQKKLSAEKVVKTLLWCKNYINTFITDREEHAKIFCKCAWLLSKFYIYQGDKSTAFELCDSAFEELQDFGISYFMRPLLRQMLKCKSVHALQRKKEKYERYLNTLTNIYVMFGDIWFPQDSILYNCYQCEYFLDYEILRGGRLTMGLTQETMISGIFTSSRSLSKIENCKAHPSKENFRKLMRNLNLQKTRFNGMVLTDSMEMLEKAQELRCLISKKKHTEMERPMRELKAKLDMSLFENWGTIQYFENVIDYANKSQSYKDILQKDYQLLQETYDINKALYRTPFHLETDYINQIALMLEKMGRKAESIALYQKVLDTFHKSRIKEKYHFQSYSIILENLAAQEESMELSKKAIRFALRYGKINSLHYDYMTYLDILEKTGKVKKENCRAMLEEIITLCSLVKNEKDLAIAQQHYQEKYSTAK